MEARNKFKSLEILLWGQGDENKFQKDFLLYLLNFSVPMLRLVRI